MKIIDSTLESIDNIQRRHKPAAFIYAVIKKYGDEETGYKAALLTYYGFLALFPLLLVATTIASMVASTNPELRTTILESINSYFPVLGSQLSSNISTFNKNGVALAIGIVFALYGARGVADVFRRGVASIWHETPKKPEPFATKLGKNIGIMLVGGIGLLAASVLAGIAAAAGQGALFRIVSVAVNLGVLFGLFTFLINASIPRHVTFRETWVGALCAAVGLLVLQALGGLVLARELKNLDALYSYFAVSLGLLFWIYLQAQMMYYAVTIAAVSSKKLWPRGLTDKNPTKADKICL